MPKRIGNYLLKQTIGKGKYSKVKYCIDLNSKKTYAMKVMSLKDIKRGRMENQLRREIAIMKMIDHDNVVKLHEVLQTDRNIYIVMDLITGGELFDKILSQEKFCEEEGRYFFQQLINGLSYCHSHGIAHRDLKLENLLIDNKKILKITDFGLSTLANKSQPNQLLKTTCGTPNYVAPEVIMQGGYNGFKADIWSCAVILYVMIAGRLPFEDKNISVLFKKIESGKYRIPKFFSKDLRDLVDKMLTVNPDKRIDIKGIKSHKWFRIGYKERINGLSHKNFEISEKDLQESITKGDRRSIEVSGEDRKKSVLGETVLGEKRKMNAFDFIEQSLMGSVSGLATGMPPPIIHRWTRFLAKLEFEETKKLIMDALKKFDANPKSKKSQDSVIKCFFYNKAKHLVSFNVVIIQTIANKLTFVEFQRRRGERDDFYDIYNRCRDSLGKIVAYEKEKNEKVNPPITTGLIKESPKTKRKLFFW